VNTKTVWFNLTSKCNNNCDFCYYNLRNSEMKYDDFLKFVPVLKKIKPNKVVLLGGEPTLHPDFLKFVDYLYKLKIKINIGSNGILFANKNFAEKVLPKVNFVVISIEGTKEVHNKLVRNSKAYDLAINGLKNLLKINKKKVAVNTAISKENISNINELVKTMNKLGVRKYGFNIGTSFTEREFIFSPAEFVNSFAPKLRDYIKKYKNIDFVVSTPIPLCFVPLDLKKYFVYGCHIFSGSGLIIDSDWRIFPCSHWVHLPYGKIEPNISYLEFKQFLKKINNLRKKIALLPSSDCNNCEYNTFCLGGCPVFWQLFNFDEEKMKLKIKN